MKKGIYLFLLILLLLGIGLSISHQILWGANTISGTDELYHFSRAYAISRGWVDPYHEYDNSKFFDLYPAGFHLLIGEFMLLSNFPSVYLIYMIFKILFSLISSLLIFLIGSKINWKVGILSIFFLSMYFTIFTSSSYYTYINAPQNYLNSTSITIISTFVTLLLYINFLDTKNKNKEIKLGLLITLFGTLHGLSHISTYMGYIANFSILFIIFLVFNFISRGKYIMYIKLLIYTLLSIPLVFLIYYSPMYSIILRPPYDISKFLPFLSPAIFPFIPAILSLLSIISIIGLIFLYIKSDHLKNYYLRLSNKIAYILIIILYISLYCITIYSVTVNPQKYNFSGFILLAGVFPTYLHLNGAISIVSIFSLIVGFLMFILTVLAFAFGLKIGKYQTKIYVILLIYIIFYIVWFIFAIVVRYYADRIIYFKFILPIIYAITIYSLIFNRKNKENKSHISLKKIIGIGIILMVISINVISLIEEEPAIRLEDDIPRPHIGTQSPPIMHPSLAVVVNKFTTPGEYILASRDTLSALGSTTHARLPTYKYSIYYTDHRNWGVTINALRGRNMDEFFEKYNARYYIIGVSDLYIGSNVWGGETAPVDMYNNNPNLLLIYVGNSDERIYLWIK